MKGWLTRVRRALGTVTNGVGGRGPVDSSAAQKASEKRLAQHGFREFELLGKGKDGHVFRACEGGSSYIVKDLSSYGRAFLPMFEQLQQARVSSEALYEPRLVDSSLLIYPDEALVGFGTEPEVFSQCLVEICELEIELVRENLLLWDFGFDHPNYMMNRSGELRWIDYGGNGFLFVAPPADAMASPRQQLVVANNEFVQLALLLHVAVFGVGQVSLVDLASRIQDDRSEFPKVRDRVLRMLGESLYGDLADVILRADLLTAEGWASVRSAAADFRESLAENPVLDKPDVSSVDFEAGAARVRGYQNYDIRGSRVRPLDIGHDWAVTQSKAAIVLPRLGDEQVRSYLDIGCNLGFFVFSAHFEFGIEASGVDYNGRYVEICREIASHLGAGCQFETASFSELEGSYDCVSMLGVIHHLFHRTEGFGDLDPILERLAAMTRRIALVEFPTERDSKARKWTSMPGRSVEAEYGLDAFRRVAGRYFGEVEEVGRVTPERPVFLLRK